MSVSVEVLTRSWFVAGPTAVGKTALSLRLAEQLGAEIISLDSMAIYREMDIGTAKPTATELAQVPHHLINVADPHEEFSVAEFVARAAAAATDIAGRGRVPLFVGGTGLYLRALLRGISAGPAADWELRHELQERVRESGPESLHEELRRLDPEAAERLHPNDVKRVIRAIEVCRLTGTPLSATQHHGPRPRHEQPHRVVWLNPPREWLRQRIAERVSNMMAEGLLEETRRLLHRKPPVSRTARQALGYRELFEHLTKGVPLKEAVTRISTATQQFAKRQHTWFRNLEECHSLEVRGTESVTELCQMVMSGGTSLSSASD